MYDFEMHAMAIGGNNDNVKAMYTRDSNMIGEGNEMYAGVQGGFLMVRPSERAFMVSDIL